MHPCLRSEDPLTLTLREQGKGSRARRRRERKDKFSYGLHESGAGTSGAKRLAVFRRLDPDPSHALVVETMSPTPLFANSKRRVQTRARGP